MKTDIKFSERSILEDCNHWLLKKAFTVWCYYSFLFCYLVFCLRKIVCLKWNMFAKLPQTRMVNSMCVACLNNCMPFCQHCKDKQWRNVPTWRGSVCKIRVFANHGSVCALQTGLCCEFCLFAFWKCKFVCISLSALTFDRLQNLKLD